MYYSHIVPATFLCRPNRFIAHCEIGGQTHICHVKNTGRCKELLVPGCRVYVQDCPSPTRKTRFDVIACEKNGVLFNIDSAAPNKAAAEFLPSLFPTGTVIKSEVKYGASRMDFCALHEEQTTWIEVKGVTLEQGSIAYFPDAPTLRGVRHVEELTAAVEAGQEALLLFVIQTTGIKHFCPNDVTHPAFGQALRKAHKAGVRLLAMDCSVTPNSMNIQNQIPIVL